LYKGTPAQIALVNEAKNKLGIGVPTTTPCLFSSSDEEEEEEEKEEKKDTDAERKEEKEEEEDHLMGIAPQTTETTQDPVDMEIDKE
jgi:hypothetical protein